jgi:hypothetical protein
VSSSVPETESRFDVAGCVGSEGNVGLSAHDTWHFGDTVGHDRRDALVVGNFDQRDEIDLSGHRVGGLDPGDLGDRPSGTVDGLGLDLHEAQRRDHG